MYNTHKYGGGSKPCQTCGKKVYPLEMISVNDMAFHKACFKCLTCNRVLSPGNYAVLDGFYCKPHYEQKRQGGPSPSQSDSQSNANDADSVSEMSSDFPAFSEAQVRQAISIFDVHDKNKNGTLDLKEFQSVMVEIVPKTVSASSNFNQIVQLYFKDIDSDKSGNISKKEFLTVYQDFFVNERKQFALLLQTSFPNISSQNLEDLLKQIEAFDVDGDGVIDMDEIYQLKDSQSQAITQVFKKIGIEKFFKTADKDTTGKLDLHEFLSAYADVNGANSVNPSVIPKLISQKIAPATLTESVSKLHITPTVSSPSLPRSSTLNIPSGSVDKLWNQLEDSVSLVQTLEIFEGLKKACGVAPTDKGLKVYEKIKSKVVTAVPNSATFWSLLTKRLAQPEYKGSKSSKVVVVGSGPGGLRAAVEAAFLGSDVTVFEKRDEYSRNNLLHVWDSSIRDLKNIGCKYWYSQFCIGAVHHIAIRRLQFCLLKISLVLGITVIAGVQFNNVKKVGTSWVVDYTSNDLGNMWLQQLKVGQVTAEVLIGADGENSAVANVHGFERKVLQGSRAIGITANFVNSQSKEESHLTEFGRLSVYYQQFFGDLKTKYGIDLENLVYYRGETHYFVMTVKTDSLVNKGVAKTAHPSVADLLAPTNVDKSKLEELVRQVAEYIQLPKSCQFEKTPKGTPDVSIFDFSKKQQSVTPFKIVDENTPAPLLVLLVGDALVEPFWPLGTGCNRAILAALDSAWIIKNYFSKEVKLDVAKKTWVEDYKIMAGAAESDLVKNFGLHSIDPSTRYRRTTFGHFH